MADPRVQIRVPGWSPEYELIASPSNDSGNQFRA
jgi:hypothetical protein